MKDSAYRAVAPKMFDAILGLLEILPDCECDNTHKQNNTKCRICLAKELIAKIEKENQQ